MYPTREEAENLLKEAEKCNPGPWGNHSRTAAHCAEAIAAKSGMDPEKAYVLGLLHDIGRKFGKRHLGHVSDGYSYMMSLGYDDAARICLTHSFNEKDISKYVGKFDTTEEETALIKDRLNAALIDDYDRLIQLCDSIAGAEGVMDQIERMTDVKNRYGGYDQKKWDTNIKLKEYFEEKMGEDLYLAVGKGERWDLYNLDGEIIGEHTRGLMMPENGYHLVVHIWIRNPEGKYLMTKRSANKKTFPFTWECIGGSVLKGEDSFAAALREVHEEVGIILCPEHGRKVLTKIRDYADGTRVNDINDVYLFSYDREIQLANASTDEVAEAEWMTRDEIVSLYNNGQMVRMIKDLSYFIENEEGVFP